MITIRDEVEIRSTVNFYILYTTLHFPIVLVVTQYSGGFYTLGKYSSQLIILIMAIAEIIKYSIRMIWITSNFNLSKRHERLTLAMFLKSVFSKSKFREKCKIIFTIFATTAAYFIISVLYGAELFEKTEETLMFSCLMSVLTIFPICINLGPQYVILLLTGYRPVDKLEYLLFQNVYLTCLGAWLGAFVIPLDWDRPWQEWPIPCTISAMIGFQLSHVVMVFCNKITPLKKKFKC